MELLITILFIESLHRSDLSQCTDYIAIYDALTPDFLWKNLNI